MRFLVSGASGFIGSFLADWLEAREYEVRKLVRREPVSPSEAFWDPEHGKLDQAALDGVDVVVNLSGAGIAEHRWTPEYKRVLLDSRVRPTELLAKALADRAGDGSAAPLFISASGIGYYGWRDPEEELTEDSPPGSGFLAEVCRQWEAAVAPAREAGVRVLHPRFGVVIGVGGALAKLLPQFRAGLGGRLGDGRQVLSWIAIDDVAGALLHCIEHERTGPVNFCAPAPVTNAELAKQLATVLHKPAAVSVPAFALRALLGEAADELLHGQRAVPQRLLASGYRFAYPTLRDALTKYALMV